MRIEINGGGRKSGGGANIREHAYRPIISMIDRLPE
jgi:hypothetical protein